jgi:DNA (cytosine-5)-methyltransferase 1
MSGRGMFGYDDAKWLRLESKPKMNGKPKLPPFRTVDLFAGCGGLSLGIAELCRRTKREHVVEFASDMDEKILEIYKANFHPIESTSEDIDTLINGSIRSSKLTKKEREFLRRYPNAKKPDLLSGGPPCQGHSDLNNHTRRSDERNQLYFRMVRAAKVLKPKLVIIENVKTVIHSKQNVVAKSMRKLRQLGYKCLDMILSADLFGVPQKRERHFIIASLGEMPDLSHLEKFQNPRARTVRWAIEDILDIKSKSVLDVKTKCTDENQVRMNWLIKKDEYNLPNRLRCDSHKEGNTYPAVYGRMYWDKPADTITAGFTSNGQGRFTHPGAFPGRALTPHEAARIQTFPDWFQFLEKDRGVLKKAIGNAVPPLLSMCVVFVAVSTI